MVSAGTYTPPVSPIRSPKRPSGVMRYCDSRKMSRLCGYAVAYDLPPYHPPTQRPSFVRIRTKHEDCPLNR